MSKVINEQINIEGSNRINLFLQNSIKEFVFVSVKAITNPEIIKKNSTPK
jgi:hypothetical protein